MTKRDAQTFISLSEFVLKLAEQQTMLSRLVLVLMERNRNFQTLNAQLSTIPDSKEKHEIAGKLSALADSWPAPADVQKLQSSLAFSESHHEQLEAFLNTLKSLSEQLPEN
jgi:hypothetical protein